MKMVSFVEPVKQNHIQSVEILKVEAKVGGNLTT